MKSLRSFTIVALLLSAGAVRAADESPYKFEFHGFVTGSLYMQNQTLGAGGQGLLLYAPAPTNAAPCKTAACDAGTYTATQANKSATFLGGDVRQSRFVFALSGPKAFAGATPKAYFEGDLFGGSPAASGLIESWLWRIRAAYAELKWDSFTFQAGQHSAHLAFAALPDTVAHIANPYTFGAGNFGWRTLGARGFYTVPMDGSKFELAGSVVQASWIDNQSPGGAVTSIGSGMADNLPQVEARARLEGKSGAVGYNVWLDGLYQAVNLKGFGDYRCNPATPAACGVQLADGTYKTSATSYAGELGGRISFTPVYLQFNVYTGKGLGSMAGALVQAGEIEELGYYAQLGANLTKEFSLNATFGQGLPKEKDVRLWATTYGNTAPKKENTLIAAQAKYMDAGYALALEFIRYETTYLQGNWAEYQAGTQPGNIKTDGYQVIATAGYFF